MEGMQIFITCIKRNLKVSQDESRPEDKTEFHGIEEKGVIAFISALL